MPDLAEVVPVEVSASQRYATLWQQASEIVGGPLIAQVVEPYVEGSLRYARTKVSVMIGDTEVGVTNGQATFGGQVPEILRKLAFLEEVVALTTNPNA